MPRFQEHPSQAWIKRKPRQAPPDLGEITLPGIKGPHFFKVRKPSVTARGEGGSRKGNSRTSPSPNAFIRRIHSRERGTTNLRIGELGGLFQVEFIVKPYAHTLPHPAASPPPLPGAGLGDLLDLQTLNLATRIKSADTCKPAVHYIDDPRNSERVSATLVASTTRRWLLG